MNCPNCGAPMVLVHHRDYFFCEYCGTFHFPTEADDGVHILMVSPEGLKCPVCSKDLAQASIDGLRSLYCQNCRGLLLSQVIFGKLVQLRRSRATGEGERPSPINPAELARTIPCSICGKVMDTHPYYGPGNIIIDNCSTCHVIWLDAAELQSIQEAPGSDRGQPIKVEWVERSENSLLNQSLRRRGLLKD